MYYFVSSMEFREKFHAEKLSSGDWISQARIFWESNVNKSNGKCRSTFGCLDQYMRKVLGLWNSQGR